VSDQTDAPAGTQQAELGVLLAGAVRAVVSAQDVLDDHARRLVEAYQSAPAGSPALPPLWYALDGVSLDIELSSEVVHTVASAERPAATQLVCRTLNPMTVGLYGYSAATGTRVHVSLSPQRFAPATLPLPEGAPPSPT
jgi:hypothetical protein